MQRDLTGEVFTRWTVLSQAEGKYVDGSTLWNCRCSCGTERVVTRARLIRGGSKSCGCFLRERTGDLHRTHGLSSSSLYRRWKTMRSRCHKPGSTGYQYYGGRGISVCPEWHSFEVFAKWAIEAGYSDELTIDRIDNDGNYEPSNCRWVSFTENCRNRKMVRLTPADVVAIRADTRFHREIAEAYGVSISCIHAVKAGRTWRLTDAELRVVNRGHRQFARENARG